LAENSSILFVIVSYELRDVSKMVCYVYYSAVSACTISHACNCSSADAML